MKSRAPLETALLEHRSSIEAFLAAAEAVPEAQWARPVGPGKWSPGQISEHLSLTLEAVAREVRGGPPIPFRLAWWQRFWIKQRYLPGILERKQFPSGARAPREIRPAAVAAPRGEALARLGTANTGIARAYAENPQAAGRRLRHPYFGALTAPDFFAVNALHVLHHRSQLPLS